MKALTVRQPYASRLIHGHKTVENRTRNTNIRGPVLIHSAQRVHDRYAASVYTWINDLPRSAILGAAELIDSHPAATNITGCCTYELGAEYQDAHGEDFDKPLFHWVFQRAVAFEAPILDVRGALGFWTADPTITFPELDEETP